MIRKTAILWLLPMIAATAADLPDLLRFTNHDQLRGSFHGLREGPQALWKNEDLIQPAAFRTSRIRHIVLRGGRPLKLAGTLSHVDLVNGDKVPGTIIGLDEESVTLETSYAGRLRIPRNHVSMLAPNPLGGRVSYHGPFAEDGWKMIQDAFRARMPDEEPKTEDHAKGEKFGRWIFAGSSWLWKHKNGGTALVRENGMPERSVLRFNLAWKSRLNLSIALHADYAKVRTDKKDEPLHDHGGAALMNPTNLPRLFGNSHVLQVYNNYLTLLRTTVDVDGKPSIERPRMNGGATRLGESGHARIELRSNRHTGEITLFVNDEFTAQWNGQDMAGEENAAENGEENAGLGFGFVSQGGDSPVRISDIIVSEWNGMPDSARSLQMDGQDVVLMVNGTDRYSGKVGALDEQGGILFEGKHGRFHFPLEEVSEIRFARQSLAAAGEVPADNVVLRLAPIGAISGQPVPSEGTPLVIMSPIMGKIELSLEPLVMIEFNTQSQSIDDWNADF